MRSDCKLHLSKLIAVRRLEGILKFPGERCCHREDFGDNAIFRMLTVRDAQLHSDVDGEQITAAITLLLALTQAYLVFGLI